MQTKTIECPICLQPIKNEITTHCGHSFCDACIIHHLMIKNTCPMCRGVCDYNQITEQIKPNNKKTLIKHLTSPDSMMNVVMSDDEESIHSDSTESDNSMPMQMHVPMLMPISSFVMTIFIIELAIILYTVYFIVQKVNHAYNQENK